LKLAIANLLTVQATSTLRLTLVLCS